MFKSPKILWQNIYPSQPQLRLLVRRLMVNKIDCFGSWYIKQFYFISIRFVSMASRFVGTRRYLYWVWSFIEQYVCPNGCPQSRTICVSLYYGPNTKQKSLLTFRNFRSAPATLKIRMGEWNSSKTLLEVEPSCSLLHWPLSPSFCRCSIRTYSCSRIYRERHYVASQLQSGKLEKWFGYTETVDCGTVG